MTQTKTFIRKEVEGQVLYNDGEFAEIQTSGIEGIEEACSLEEFIDRWSQHIPERYRHAVRSFGHFAPRTLAQTSVTIFAVLGQQRRSRPKRRRWAESLKPQARLRT